MTAVAVHQQALPGIEDYGARFIGGVLPRYEPPAYEPGMSIDARYERFAAANPWVLAELKRRCDEIVHVFRVSDVPPKQRRISTKFLLEMIRHEYFLGHQGASFGLNNDFSAMYARDLKAWDLHRKRLGMTGAGDIAACIKTRKRRSLDATP